MALRSVARAPLWAWALLLLAAACLPAALAGGSHGYGCHGYPSHADCSWHCDSHSCKGRCKYGGEALAHCTAGHWNVTKPCPPRPTGCKVSDLHYKYVSKWSCSKGHDSSCYAYCDYGYKGVVKAICSGSTWHYYGECVKVVEQPKYCKGKPSAYGAHFPDDCYGKTYVEGTCAHGYYGDIYAKCKHGEWVVYGSCKPKCTKYCAGKPAPVAGIYWPNSCKGTSYVKAYCKTGYKPGYVEAKCECGKWVTYGSCQKIVYQYPKCYGKPKTKKYGKKWSCRGSYCTAKCGWGCYGKGYKATCYKGKWKVTGSCYRKKYVVFGHTKEHY